MSEKHISFADLSDLYDGLIQTEEEKEKILLHIEKCPECRKEYDALRATVKYLKNLNQTETRFINLSPVVMRRIKLNNNISLAKKFLPALAAAVFVFAVGLNVFSPVQDSGRAVSKGEAEAVKKDIVAVSSAPEKKQVSRREADDLLKIIARHNGTVIKDNSMYVEGEISYESFSRMRREIGFRKISYRYMAQAEPVAESAKGAPDSAMSYRSKKSDISEVSMSDKSFADEEVRVASEPVIVARENKPRVKFRVYK